MKKIPRLYKLDPNNAALVINEITPGCEWVLAPEEQGYVRPTVKHDGTACLWKEGRLWARYDAKHGKTPPPDFVPAQPAADPETGHWPGWIPVTDSPNFRWHHEALKDHMAEGATYELVGPKVNSNHEGHQTHRLLQHGAVIYPLSASTFEEFRQILDAVAIYEGIVFHHRDGRMAKLTRKNFGFPWPIKAHK